MSRIVTLALALLSCATAAFLGINLGNVLEAPVEGAWAPVAQEYYFDDYVSANFTRVRIPVRWDKHMGTAPPYTIDATFLARVKTVVSWCLARDQLTCLINSQCVPLVKRPRAAERQLNSHSPHLPLCPRDCFSHDDWIGSAPNASFPSALPRFVALWTQVAAAFADAPPSLLFEVINEPVDPLSLANLNAMYAAVVPVMRSTNPTRTIYLGGLSWMSPVWIQNNPDAIVFPPLAGGGADANLALEIHSYDPYAFCLQNPPTQASWGTPSDVAVVTSMYAAAAKWGANHGGKKVYMGEAGCQVVAARAGRLVWYRTVGKAAQSIEGITIWDDFGDYKIYNRDNRTWDTGVLDALFGRG